MPKMDGYEATRRIRDPETGVLNNKVPIIAMTAHAMQGDREKSLSAGMNDHVSKPITREALVNVLEKRLPAFYSPSSAAQTPPSLKKGACPELAGIDVKEALSSLDMDFDSFKVLLLDFREDVQKARNNFV